MRNGLLDINTWVIKCPHVNPLLRAYCVVNALGGISRKFGTGARDAMRENIKMGIESVVAMRLRLMEKWTYWGGITRKGEARAAASLVHMLEAVRIAGDKGVAEAVLAEAAFRLFELPNRSAVYQRAYMQAQAPKRRRKSP